MNIDALCEKRKAEILNAPDALEIVGTKYYVSNAGDDNNDGLSPDTAWKTLSRLEGLELPEGDGVLFRRGDIFRGQVPTCAGVGYGAYGEGEKPKFYGGEKDYADPELWELFNADNNIWHLKEKILDVGTLVFNHGEKHSVKLIPSYINGQFVCREDESRVFDVCVEAVRDLDVYWHFDEVLT